jgi:hypothetical protein
MQDLRAAMANAGLHSGRSVLHHSVKAPDGTQKFLLQVHTVLVFAQGVTLSNWTVKTIAVLQDREAGLYQLLVNNSYLLTQS